MSAAASTATSDHDVAVSTLGWDKTDPRFCRRCNRKDQVILFSRAPQSLTWKCENCRIVTARRWRHEDREGLLELGEHNCLCALTELTYDLIRNDDDIARIDTMCTLTMHGEEWSAKYTDWAKWMGFSFQKKPHEVTYRFGGGEKKVSSIQEILPIGIGKFRGCVKSQCIPKSSAPLLLSLDVQRALGMILDVNRDTVDFVNLGLYHLPLIRTQDGGLGVRITDFARKDILHPER